MGVLKLLVTPCNALHACLPCFDSMQYSSRLPASVSLHATLFTPACLGFTQSGDLHASSRSCPPHLRRLCCCPKHARAYKQHTKNMAVPDPLRSLSSTTHNPNTLNQPPQNPRPSTLQPTGRPPPSAPNTGTHAGQPAAQAAAGRVPQWHRR
eukprot:365111-Chlamydomonas_euryale.AAC.9